MGLLPIQSFSGLADRASQQIGVIKSDINSVFNTGSKFYPRITQAANPTQGDASIIGNLINSSYALDNNVISGTFIKSTYGSFINDLDTHFVNNKFANTDAYLLVSGIVNGVPVHVHPNFDDIYFQSRGSHLSSVNIFNTSVNLMGAYYATGSGTGIFSAGTNLNNSVTSAYSSQAAGTAPATFILVNVGTQLASAQVNLTLVAANGNSSTYSDSCNISVLNNAVSGLQYPVIGSSPSRQYLSVSNIIVAGSTSGMAFNVYSNVERTLSSASL